MTHTFTASEAGWMETMDIMAHPEEVAAIEAGVREKERGELVTLEQLTKNLGV